MIAAKKGLSIIAGPLPYASVARHWSLFRSRSIKPSTLLIVKVPRALPNEDLP